MDRQNIDQDRVDFWRADYEAQTAYAPYADPLPGSHLKLDDDVFWLADFPVRVVWGTDNPSFFLGYCPDIFGDYAVPLQAEYITDRAPADPQETPMPIYPVQQQQQQRQPTAADKHNGKKKALQAALKSLPPEAAKKAREKIRALQPDLLGKDE